MRLVFLCIAIVPLVAATGGQKNIKVAKAFKTFDLYPYIFSTAPSEFLSLNYPTAEVCLGDVISQTRTMVPPQINYDFKPGVKYTLIMLDPDVPSAQNPALRSYLVWMLVNIYVDGNGKQVQNTVAGYIPPTPYPGSGFHRFTTVIFKQTKDIDLKTVLSLRLGIKRYRFDVVAFAKQFGLGDPIAGNFFSLRVPALYDEYYCTNDPTCSAG